MSRIFPIRLDTEIKYIPWGMIEPHNARCVMNKGKPLEAVSMEGGLTPEEALAILEDRPFERMPFTGATLLLKQKVEDWNRSIQHVDMAELEGKVLGDRKAMAHGRALHALSLARSMRDGRRVVNRTNWNELITALEGLQELTR